MQDREDALRDLEVNRRIRVLHVIFSLSNAGMEGMVYELIKGTDVKRFLVSAFCLSSRGEHGDKLAEEGYLVEVISPLRGFSVRHLFALIRFLRRSRVEIIHAHNPTAWFYAAVANFLSGNRRLVVTLHGMEHLPRKRDIWIDRILSRITDRVVTVSDRMNDFIANVHCISRSKIRTVLNGIDVHRFSSPKKSQTETRARLDLSEGAKVVGSVGRIMAVKNYRLLLEAMIPVFEKLPGTRLLLVGDGPLKESCQIFCKENEIEDKVIFLGHRNDIAELLSVMDVFVLPSLYEGTSLSLLEAMAAGRAVVATDVGGNSRVVKNGQNGLLVPVGDRSAMTEEILGLLNEPQRTASLGRAAFQDVSERFERRRMICEYEDIYLKCLKDHSFPGHNKEVPKPLKSENQLRGLLLGRYKEGVSWGLYRSGLASLHKNYFSVPVSFCYHRVLDNELAAGYPFRAMVVSRSNFERQIEILRRHYKIVSPQELVDRLTRRSSSQEKAVALTFDDGYNDCYDYVYPLLRAYDIPATFFLTIDLIGNERLHWYDEVALRIENLLMRSETLPSPIRELVVRYPKAVIDREHRAKMIRSLIQQVKDRSEEERESLLNDLISSGSQIDSTVAARHKCLTWEKVREMSRGGMEFGSHGCSHSILTKLPYEIVRQELLISKKKLELELGKKVDLFSYPNGDLNNEIATLVSEVGYKIAFTMNPYHEGKKSNVLRMLRRNISDAESSGMDGKFSEYFFFCEVSGLAEKFLFRRLRGLRAGILRSDLQ